MEERLDDHQSDHYTRHLMLDAVGTEDQKALLQSSVLVAGAGGLGSTIIQYLAGAGVGTIGIADSGTVKRSNLHRQIIYEMEDIGNSKVECAARFVKSRNPDVEIQSFEETIDSGTVEQIIDGFDIVVDGLDDFKTRYLLNDSTQIARIPFVHGAVYAFEGQTTTFLPGGPCYRCHLPEVPDSSQIPSGEPMPIFPTLPGTIGCIQATEALKILLEIGTSLEGRLLRYDATDVTFVETPIDREAECPVCSADSPDSIDGFDYTMGR